MKRLICFDRELSYRITMEAIYEDTGYTKRLEETWFLKSMDQTIAI